MKQAAMKYLQGLTKLKVRLRVALKIFQKILMRNT